MKIDNDARIPFTTSNINSILHNANVINVSSGGNNHYALCGTSLSDINQIKLILPVWNKFQFIPFDITKLIIWNITVKSQEKCYSTWSK